MRPRLVSAVLLLLVGSLLWLSPGLAGAHESPHRPAAGMHEPDASHASHTVSRGSCPAGSGGECCCTGASYAGTKPPRIAAAVAAAIDAVLAVVPAARGWSLAADAHSVFRLLLTTAPPRAPPRSPISG